MRINATINQWLEGIAGYKDRWSLLQFLGPMGDRYSACALSSAGLVIKAGGSTLAKTGAATTTLSTTAPGTTGPATLVQIAASTDMPALTGINITATYFNIVCFFVDSAGTVTASAGTEAATLAGVKWPIFPTGQALVGFLTITYASPFVGGTTPLDTATTTYNSPTGAFDPNVLPGFDANY